MQSYLMDASKQCMTAGRKLESADSIDTGTFAAREKKRRLLIESQANLNAALARIESAIAEVIAEESCND